MHQFEEKVKANDTKGELRTQNYLKLRTRDFSPQKDSVLH